MRIRSLFSRRPTSAVPDSSPAAQCPAEEPVQLTPEQLVDLKDAGRSSAAQLKLRCAKHAGMYERRERMGTEHRGCPPDGCHDQGTPKTGHSCINGR